MTFFFYLAQGTLLASLFGVKGPPLFSLVCLNLMVCMQFKKNVDSFIQMFTFIGAPKETLNIKKYTKCYSTLCTDCSTQEVFTADRDGDRIFRSKINRFASEDLLILEY